MNNVDQGWLDGFVKAAVYNGITDPNDINSLLELDKYAELAEKYPNQFEAGFNEALEKAAASGFWGHVGQGALAGGGVGGLGGGPIGALIGGGIGALGGGLTYALRGGRQGYNMREITEGNAARKDMLSRRAREDKAMGIQPGGLRTPYRRTPYGGSYYGRSRYRPASSWNRM